MPLIQYGPALGVGTAGYNELIDFDSPDELEEREFLDRINSVSPPGLRFKSLLRRPAGSQSLIKEINRAEYSVKLDAPEIEAAIQRRCADRDWSNIHPNLIESFMARENCVIERVRKDKRQQVDVRRFTRRLSVTEDLSRLIIVTEVSPNGGVKPVEVVAAVFGLTEAEKTSLSSRVRRLRLYSEDQTGDPECAPIAAALTSEQGDKTRVTIGHS